MAPHSKQVVVVGGGPAGLMAAQVCAEAGLTVALYDAMPAVGRKFLVAGHGGLNLSHDEPRAALVQRYGTRADQFRRLLAGFGPEDLRQWAERLGIATFVGTSRRIFPDDFKAATLLSAWTKRLRELGVVVHQRHRWQGFTASGEFAFAADDGSPLSVRADAMVLALGGASWPQTGSDGAWTTVLAAHRIAIAPLRPANCGFDVAWSAVMRERGEAKPLKNLALSFAGTTVRGELLLTRYGVEGGGVYALSGALREALAAGRPAILHVDCKPDLSAAQLLAKLQLRRGKDSFANQLRKRLHLSPATVLLVREFSTAEERADPVRLAARIKDMHVPLTAPRPIAEAISSAGGIDFAEVDDGLMLRKLPGVFVAGEMLDWEAPTGGYLLQGAFSTGHCAGHGVLKWLRGEATGYR